MPTRAATTTTATPGSATSATRGRQPPSVGAGDLLDAAVGFVSARLLEHGPRLAPAYTVDGGRLPGEARLHLPGYPGGHGRDRQPGAAASSNSTRFGEALLLFATAAAVGPSSDSDGWKAVEVAAQAIGERWQEPDAGIWELDDRRWTHSRLTASAGLRAVAGVRPGNGTARSGYALADHILAHAGAHALHPEGYWQRAEDDPSLDAALLLSGIRGAVHAGGSTYPRDARCVPARADPGRLRLPVPPRRPAAA